MYIEIKSSDKYGEVQNIRHKCIKNKKNGKVEYFYSDETGDNYIILSDKFELIRKNKFESRMVLERNKETLFFYKNEYMDAEFKVFGEKLEFFENGAALKYVLSDKGGIINIIEMEIIEVE